MIKVEKDQPIINFKKGFENLGLIGKAIFILFVSVLQLKLYYICFN